MGRRAIIMDRDSTLCDDLGTVRDVEQVRLLPGSAAAIRSANESGFQAVLITPFSKDQRGENAETLLDEINERVRELLASEGARLDGIYDRPSGIFSRARDEMGIDLSASYLIGDRALDLEEGHRAGTTNVLVRSGCADGESEQATGARRRPPDHVAADLGAAVRWILEREGAR